MEDLQGKGAMIGGGGGRGREADFKRKIPRLVMRSDVGNKRIVAAFVAKRDPP